MYINCKTYFSLRYGTFTTEELVSAGVATGATALALTNINNTCDAWDFVHYCQEQQIKPILGAEIRNGHQLLYILIAANNTGFKWINEFLSQHLLEKKPFPSKTTETIFFDTPTDGFVIYPLHAKSPDELLTNEVLGIQPTEVYKLLKMPITTYRNKFVIRQPVTVQNKGYYTLHRLLRAIDKNVLLSKLPSEELAGPDEQFLPLAKLYETFSQYPSILSNTLSLIEACNISLDESPVVPYHEQKSISTERTFQPDTIDLQFFHAELVRMTETIGFELRNQDKLTGTVTVKLRYSNFDTVVRQKSIDYTNADHILLAAAQEIFSKLFERRMLVRLLGIRFTKLVLGNYQIKL